MQKPKKMSKRSKKVRAKQWRMSSTMPRSSSEETAKAAVELAEEIIKANINQQDQQQLFANFTSAVESSCLATNLPVDMHLH